MSCAHDSVEPVQLIATDPKTGWHKVYAEAYKCLRCNHEPWVYQCPEDLPHWLYVRLENTGMLPLGLI